MLRVSLALVVSWTRAVRCLSPAALAFMAAGRLRINYGVCITHAYRLVASALEWLSRLRRRVGNLDGALRVRGRVATGRDIHPPDCVSPLNADAAPQPPMDKLLHRSILSCPHGQLSPSSVLQAGALRWL